MNQTHQTSFVVICDMLTNEHTENKAIKKSCFIEEIASS